MHIIIKELIKLLFQRALLLCYCVREEILHSSANGKCDLTQVVPLEVKGYVATEFCHNTSYL